MKRRKFLKLSASACAALAALELKGNGMFTPAAASTAKMRGLPGSLGAKDIPSVCEMCFWRCPIVGKVKDGKLIKIEGNPKSPANGTRICARGNSGIQLLYDPDRVKYPLRRNGERGEGKWARISWDEALDEVAHNLKKVKEKYGPHALAYFDHGASAEFMRGIFKDLGTENYTNEPAFFQCVGPAALAFIESMGYIATGTRQYIDMKNARAILLVGSHIGENIHVSHVREYMDGVAGGAKLVVVDPRFSAPAGKADLHLPIRPGTDTALLLAWMNFIIENGLYDREFVANHCTGFDDVKAAMKGCTLEWAAPICDLKPEEMKKAIIMLAEARPHVAIHPGRHSTWYGRGDTSRHQALGMLAALFGAVGVPGGLYFPTPVKKAHPECAECGKEPETPDESIQDDYYPFASIFGSPTGKIIEASLTGDPYPVKLWGINGMNILQTIPDPYATMKAIKKLDFIFCEEILPTETAIWSDIVLPGATYLERYDSIYTYDLLTPYLTVRQPMIKPMFEARSPYWIARQLAKRLGLNCFKCADVKEIVEEELKGAGLTLKSLDEKGGLVSFKANPYRERKDLKFKTDSSKIELSVKNFEYEDLDPIPKFIPTPAPPKGYARLIYGRVPVHTFSRTMNNLWLYHEWPENKLWLNDEAAEKMGLKDGEEVVLENQDSVKSLPIKLKVTPGIRADAVYMAHGYGSRSKMMTKAFRKGASDQFMITEYENDPYMGASSHRTDFVRIVKGSRVIDIPDLCPVPPQIPRFELNKAKTGGKK